MSARSVEAKRPSERSGSARLSSRSSRSSKESFRQLLVSKRSFNLSAIQLIDATCLPALPTPWPRNQDVPAEALFLPESDDLIVAVSHGWSYQHHPDPLAEKKLPVVELVNEATASHAPPGRTLVFFDFLSVAQRPRTNSEDTAFLAALQAMPKLFVEADAVVHLDAPLSDVPEPHAFGLRNHVPAGERGWVFLERFCSMVKYALVAEVRTAVGLPGRASSGDSARKASCPDLLTVESSRLSEPAPGAEEQLAEKGD